MCRPSRLPGRPARSQSKNILARQPGDAIPAQNHEILCWVMPHPRRQDVIKIAQSFSRLLRTVAARRFSGCLARPAGGLRRAHPRPCAKSPPAASSRLAVETSRAARLDSRGLSTLDPVCAPRSTRTRPRVLTSRRIYLFDAIVGESLPTDLSGYPQTQIDAASGPLSGFFVLVNFP